MKPITRLPGIMLLSGYSLLASALADTTIDPASKYAYGANIGWINAGGDNSNGAVIGRFYCSGFLYAANVGWISLGSGPTNGWQYGNNSSSDWGINHDGAGNLSGYAYGANIGWINFEQARGKPRVNTSSGALSGYAWGANVGWINLDGVRTTTIDSGPDSDNDGLPDAWEIQRTGGTAALAGGGADADSDGSSDSAEYYADTDPTDVTSFLTVSSQEVGLASGNSVNLAWLSRQGIDYSVMVSDDLVNWAALNETPIAGTGGELSKEFSFDGASRWLRISAWRSDPQLSDTKDALFAQMQAVVDWGFSAANAYEDVELTVQVSDGSAVEAFKGFGNDMPDLSNLYLVSPDFVVEDLWFGHEGVKSRYWDKGDYDRFLNIHNTLHISYETDPGQVSGLSGDTDQVYMFRLWHGTFWEEVALGLKWIGNNTFVFYGQNGEAFTSAPVTPQFGTDYMLRLTYKTSDLSIKVYLNGEEIISDHLVAPRDIREFRIGTNSHPLAQHFRFYGLKRGEFTDAELATLENNSNGLWPRGQKPSFPYIDGVGSGVHTDFDRETNAWTLPAGERINFVGGSGEPGAHLYQWYYWNPDLDADGGSGPLDRHFPFVGATTVTLDRDDYKAVGEPFHGHAGDGFNRVFCVITPVDSEGVQGVALRSTIWYDNIR